jgi:O-antigen/teichoic acid export membrane protein
MQSEPEARGGFLFNVNVVFLTQVATYGFAFGLRVVLARGLGDEGLGTFALFFLTVLIVGGIANLGVGLGNIFFLNKGTYGQRVLLANSLAFLAWASIALWALLAVFALAFGPGLFVSDVTYWLYALAFPAAIAYTLLTSFLHGTSRFVALSAVAVAQGALSFGSVLALYIADELDVTTAAAAWSLSFLAADFLCLGLIGIRNVNLVGIVAPKLDVLWQQIRYGAQGQLANMAALFNYRFDQYLVAAFASTAAVGQYVVAVGLGESVWWISSAVAVVLLPRLTSMDDDDAREVTPLVCRNTLLISVIAAIGLIIVSPAVIYLLFGSEFYPESEGALVLLMPGIVAASATRVLGSYLFSRGRVIYNTFATFIAGGVTIGLDLLLIPLLGIEGAAAASSIAYIAAMVATLRWYSSVSGARVSEALIWRPSDTSHYRRVIGRLRSRSAAVD